MNFVIRNQANISNKYIRFAKWKIPKLSRKFYDLLYSEIYIKKESAKPTSYKVIVRLRVPGPDIIVSAHFQNLIVLWFTLSSKIKRQLRKTVAKYKLLKMETPWS